MPRLMYLYNLTGVIIMHTSRENNYKSQRNRKRAFWLMSTMADKFYGSSRRPLGLVNRVGEGNRQKKRRTEDLDLSAVVRIASETTAPGHKGGSDSELSGA